MKGKEGSKTMAGALVLYCGHAGCFVADITEIEGACVVRANGPIMANKLIRTDLDKATHHVLDSPGPSFWRPDLGVFVVPSGQVKVLKNV